MQVASVTAVQQASDYQIDPLHETVSSPILRMPGIWPLVTWDQNYLSG